VNKTDNIENYRISAIEGFTPEQYCELVLPRVSRTFALSIRVLRGHFYNSVLVSYLLCRILDTIEDSAFFDFSSQEELFIGFMDIFNRANYSDEYIELWVDSFFARAILKSNEDNYYFLVRNTRLVVANYLNLPENYKNAIKACVLEMGQGMMEMARRKTTAGHRYFIKTEKDLEKYCYYVAGTVGILTTRLLREYSDRIDERLFNYLRERSVSLGLGLQMTNILKDCWADRQRDICYIPRDVISRYNLSVDNFFSAENRIHACAVIDDLASKAARHLDRGVELITSIPLSQYRVRLSCLWPLFFAVQTLVDIKSNSKLLDGKETKISRKTVKKLLRNTTVLGWSNAAIKQYYKTFRRLL
jgi:farnesyl-diphosphate farnesyltransferase